MIGNVTTDDFCDVCEKFNLEFYALDEDYIMLPKNIKLGEIFGSIAAYNIQSKTMCVSKGISVVWMQNRKTLETIFSHFEFQSHIMYSNVNDAKKQIQNVLKNYKDIKVKLKIEEIEKDFKND